eukprot:3568847-Ditylum_brightwellii.AAC.3
MVNVRVLITHPMKVMSSHIVPLAASLRRERTLAQRMGSCWDRGQNRRWRASGSEALALAIVSGLSRATVMPSSM